MQSIKKLKINFDKNMVFILPTDIKIQDLKIKTLLDYKSVKFITDIDKKFIIDFFRDNPVSKYPLIDNYYLFYNFILDKFIDGKDYLKESEVEYFSSIHPGYNYNRIDEIGEDVVTKVIVNSPKFSYLYSLDRSKKVKKVSHIDDLRWKEGEWIISRSPQSSSDYLTNIIYPGLMSIHNDKKSFVLRVIKEKFKDFESSIIKDPSTCLQYVKNVIGDIYPFGEDIILSDDFTGQQYITDIVYDSILKNFDGDHNETRKEIIKRYSEFHKKMIGRHQYNIEVITNYLKKIISIPNPNIEKQMVDSGKELGYFEFLKNYFYSQENKKNPELEFSQKIKNVGNKIIDTVKSPELVKLAKEYIDKDGKESNYSFGLEK